VVPEAETDALRRAVRGEVLLASDLVRTELRRAVRRAAPLQGAVAESVLARLRLVRLDADVLDAAGRLDPPVLRSLDAIHLACALLLGAELDAFVTYDVRQAEAASAAGLTVSSPR